MLLTLICFTLLLIIHVIEIYDLKSLLTINKLESNLIGNYHAHANNLIM